MLKYFYKNYEPIFVTWNDDFYEKTKEFVELIKVTSVSDEGGDPIDWHRGSKGSYDFLMKKSDFLTESYVEEAIEKEQIKSKKRIEKLNDSKRNLISFHSSRQNSYWARKLCRLLA